MSEESIREQIKATLSAVDGIGVVHDYQRWAATWEKFLNLFRDADNKINGWMISRARTPERWLSNIQFLRVYEYTIRGVYALSDADASELVFQGLIEDICSAFRNEDTLNETCETTNPEFGSLSGLSGVQVEVVEPRLFGTVLCHYTELRLAAQTTEDRSV
jgi:hypothetical protein